MESGRAWLYLEAALKALTLGRDNQSFLGARWIALLLRRAPSPVRRRMALSVLSWSPHYFYRHPEYNYEGLSHAEFTEREFQRNRTTRAKIGQLVLAPHLHASQVVLDYGCGPGFMLHHIAGLVQTIYGVDISKGVLECAKILNSTPNGRFLHTSDLTQIGDATIDLVYSVAVVQHIRDSLLAGVLDTLRRKLKPTGKLLMHIPLDQEGWRTEAAWQNDTSVSGRLKLAYGLNCFSRSEQRIREMLEASGFKSVVVRPMREMCPEPFDDVCTQHIVYAEAA
jgi:SAM-dependent methyltransferase